VEYVHHRPMGSSTGPWLRGKAREGAIAYQLGSHPLFVLARALRQLHERPYLVGGAALWGGYAWSALRGAEQHPDAACRDHLRRAQVERLRNVLRRR